MVGGRTINLGVSFYSNRKTPWTPQRPDTPKPFPSARSSPKERPRKYSASPAPTWSSVVAKDDITAGDGAKHDVIPDKGRLATATTCNVFRLLKACGLPVAFEEQNSATSFIAPPCTMLPYEVVVRREAHGSALKRSPHFAKGQLFPKLLVEFYLKTKDKDWKGKPLVADDPLMQYEDGGAQIKLFNPAKPILGSEPFLVLQTADVFSHPEEYKFFPEMRRIARQAFLVLERAWALEGGTLVDFKVEFGFDAKGNLLLADVIDNNSWRVLENGAYIDKQVYRDGGALDTVAAKYKQVAETTGHFRLPRQRIILWRGSESDKTEAFAEALGELKDLMTVVTCSIHKEPVARRGHPQPHDPGGAGHGRDRLHRPLQRRRPGAVGAVDRAGHHGAGERQGVPRGRLVVAARAEQGAGDDGAGAGERRAGGAANPLGPQSAHLRACARRDREPHGQYAHDLSAGLETIADHRCGGDAILRHLRGTGNPLR